MAEQTSNTSKRGFASMDLEKQRHIASKGGEASGGNFKNDPRRAAAAGRKGGEISGGNFRNNPQRAAEAGRKGGEASSIKFKSRSPRSAGVVPSAAEGDHEGRSSRVANP